PTLHLPSQLDSYLPFRTGPSLPSTPGSRRACTNILFAAPTCSLFSSSGLTLLAALLLLVRQLCLHGFPVCNLILPFSTYLLSSLPPAVRGFNLFLLLSAGSFPLPFFTAAVSVGLSTFLPSACAIIR
ncbi:Os01g0100650, partial [Oryza sativa Japonica Group]